MNRKNGIRLLYNDQYAVRVAYSLQSREYFLTLYTNDGNSKWLDTDIFLCYPQDYFDNDFIVSLNVEVERLIKIYEKGDKTNE